MTYEEFLSKLRETPREWAINDLSQIRNNNTDLLAKCYDVTCPGMVCGIFGEVSYSIANAWQVANAADNYVGHDPKIRRDLLEACGLSE